MMYALIDLRYIFYPSQYKYVLLHDRLICTRNGLLVY